MREAFDYLLLRGSRNSVSGLRSALDEAHRSLTDAGATLAGAWLGAGSIGWSDDEAVVLLGWPGQREDITAWGARLVPDAESEVIALRATARPARPAPLRTGGVHAHRWLYARPDTVDEIVDLSTHAWPVLEANFEARVEGLFRSEDDSGRLLLVTWYASFAEWERSRQVVVAERGDLAVASRQFQRRRELTRRQIVRLARPLA